MKLAAFCRADMSQGPSDLKPIVWQERRIPIDGRGQLVRCSLEMGDF